MYPFQNHIVRSFIQENHPTDQVLTERGICHTVNTPLSPLLKKPIENEPIEITEAISCSFQNNQCYMKLDFYDNSATVGAQNIF